MYDPLCWQGYDKDPGGFKTTMWYEIMLQFDCKVSSTWSVCGKGRAEAFTHRHLNQDRSWINEKWTGWKPTTEDQSLIFLKGSDERERQ